MATKVGLEGRWRIVRRIEDRRGPDASFRGEGVFSPTGDKLIWREEGALHISDNAPIIATRKYIWRFLGGLVFVDYADGAPFHGFTRCDPSAVHHCGSDRYAVVYEFHPPDHWTAIWRVTGPSKDYRMVSEMTRL